MAVQGLLRSRLRLAMIPLVLLFPLIGHAEERYMMLNLGMNFGVKGVEHAELGLMSQYMRHDDMFDRSPPIRFARYAFQPASSQWSFDLLGTRIASSGQYELYAEEEGSGENAGKGVATAVLIGGLVLGGLYLLADEAFDDAGDDLVKNADVEER